MNDNNIFMKLYSNEHLGGMETVTDNASRKHQYRKESSIITTLNCSHFSERRTLARQT